MPTTQTISQARINQAAWEACDTFRGVVDPAEYKNYILVMLFLKYLSDVHADKRAELEQQYPDDPKRVERLLGYEPIKMPEESTFGYLHKHRGADDIGQKINMATTALEDANRGKLEGVFREIDFNSTRNLGEPKQRNQRLKHLLEDFAKPELDLRPSRVGNIDVIGNTYEYLIQRFASDSGKKGGEFYTPPEVSELMARIVDPQPGYKICDPTCGSSFVKEKSKEEILEHYFLINEDHLTNLGVLWIGKRTHRAKLLYAPSIQYIKYNEQDEKINKITWDDHSLNPKELIENVWQSVADWKEGIEIQDGLFRQRVANYDEVVVRELLANALVHRPYTIRGDIFINLFPDRMEVHNPGAFPLGVTPQNILHKSVQRNVHLAKIFYDLQLMEKEGSGYDKIYATLLSAGKPLPKPEEGRDRIAVTVEKRIVKKEVVRFMENVLKSYDLKLKEVISLGLIAQNTSLTALEFSNILDLEGETGIRNWIGGLVDLGLLKQKGRTKGTTYYVDPELLRSMEFKGKTTLKNIEPHRLRALVVQDLNIYGESSFSEIHNRIGLEIPTRMLRSQIKNLLEKDEIKKRGKKKGTKYFIDEKP